MPAAYAPFSADGHEVVWSTWDGEHTETATLRWENEGWTIGGIVGRERVQYAIRTSATWRVRQFLLFRDLDEPDLWLATDGAGRWGEMNGAHRPELDGAYDVNLDCTPSTTLLPIRRLQLHEGDAAEMPVVTVDTETLQVQRVVQRYVRVADRRWSVTHHDGTTLDLDVDEHGLALDVAGRFRRVAPSQDISAANSS
ncbi:MAG: putative glycolipid-binding domain-containing protein [Ilumatobacteraceae bacterium]